MNGGWLIKIPITIAVGIIVGLGLAQLMLRLSLSDDRESFFQGRWATTGKTDSDSALGIAVRGKSTIDLGEIQSGRRLVQEVMLENRANGAAEFWISGEPPAALRLDIPIDKKIKIEARGTYPLTVSSIPNQLQAEFKKLLVLQTNQGDRKVLITVTGKVVGGIALTPDRLLLSRTVWDQGQVVKLFLVTSQDSPPEITSVSVRGLGTPAWLKSEISPIAAAELPKLRETMGENVKSGWQVQLSANEPLPASLPRFSLLLNTQAKDFEILECPVEVKD